MDLFTANLSASEGNNMPHAPLAVRMRPQKISEVVGQEHLLQPGQPLRRLIENTDDSTVTAVFLWGPPGIGKTTLAYLMAAATGRRFVEISAVAAGIKELRAEIATAKHELAARNIQTVLFIDEVHRFSKTQQDALLPAVENRWVTLIAATTENPSLSVISPLLSRSLLLTLHPLTASDLDTLITRALTDPRGFNGQVTITLAAKELLIRFAGNDGRRVLTLLEAAASTGITEIDVPQVEAAVDQYAVRYDRNADQHYNVISAFIKSIRGSDADAAIHYLARMLEAGEDPRFIGRRIVISAAEDIGLADPQALQIALQAMQAVSLIGMPEARIILAQAVIYLATAPKSNSAYKAINAALADVRAGKGGQVPLHLWDQNLAASRQYVQEAGKTHDYIYPHDFPAGIVAQTYLPDDLQDVRYYVPTRRGREGNITENLQRINKALGKS